MLSLLRTAASLARPQWAAPSSSLLRAGLRPDASLLRTFHASAPSQRTLNQSMRSKPPQRKPRPTAPLLENNPQRKGVVSGMMIMKPKKPNSAKRKVARVKLSNGNVVHAYLMGEGALLQDHSVVLVRGGRAQDLPGVRYKVVRGAHDFGPVVNRRTARSKYGVKKPKK
ncbi:mitochondrial 30S ribosomal protein S12 [Rhodofomes roseus]|uniref:Mitochondrial 30S ribosomal protein S12 n=1 Tax=Rhodofomes roseus TaxID=34475 RepID=A0A4Y9YE68_9APHY|nr:mitochondrial 30S ribosomal protein S12 [Rhodofomes roseus]KAH9841573.1 mitochondrial 30S ribosomal protein S12 [Rhodofomes roseus]TFY60492.1 hypothetical protein EVJ58_g5110 [Rhodofomes roseus]